MKILARGEGVLADFVDTRSLGGRWESVDDFLQAKVLLCFSGVF